MSLDATVAAWWYIREPNNADLDVYAVAILLALADRYNGSTGLCNPSINRIAADCHCSPAKVKVTLRLLEDRGVIRRAGGGGAVSNRYQFLVHNPATVQPGHATARPQRGHHLATTEPGPGHSVATNQERTRKEPVRPLTPNTNNPNAYPDCPLCAGSGYRTVIEGGLDVIECDCFPMPADMPTLRLVQGD